MAHPQRRRESESLALRTFIDSGVLIAAARGTGPTAAAALTILGDEARVFKSSDFVRLEVVPRAAFHGLDAEHAFYQRFFDEVETWIATSSQLVRRAFREAQIHGLSAMDALHVAAAIRGSAEELVTTERQSSPLNRVATPRIVSI